MNPRYRFIGQKEGRALVYLIYTHIRTYAVMALLTFRTQIPTEVVAGKLWCLPVSESDQVPLHHVPGD